MSHFRIHLSAECQGHVEDVWPEHFMLIESETCASGYLNLGGIVSSVSYYSNVFSSVEHLNLTLCGNVTLLRALDRAVRVT